MIKNLAILALISSDQLLVQTRPNLGIGGGHSHQSSTHSASHHSAPHSAQAFHGPPPPQPPPHMQHPHAQAQFQAPPPPPPHMQHPHAQAQFQAPPPPPPHMQHPHAQAQFQAPPPSPPHMPPPPPPAFHGPPGSAVTHSQTTTTTTQHGAHPSMATPSHSQTTTTTHTVQKSGGGMVPPVPTMPVHSLASTSAYRPPIRSTTVISTTTHHYPPPPPSFGSSLSSVHLHMHAAPVSFLPAYHYESGMGLTLYHHNHYVHYSVMDLIIRAILYIVLGIIVIYLLCYLIKLCLQPKDEQEQLAYANELDSESIIVEEKIEVVHHADGAVTEHRTVATSKYDYQDHGSDNYQANAYGSQQRAGHNMW